MVPLKNAGILGARGSVTAFRAGPSLYTFRAPRLFGYMRGLARCCLGEVFTEFTQFFEDRHNLILGIAELLFCAML